MALLRASFASSVGLVLGWILSSGAELALAPAPPASPLPRAAPGSIRPRATVDRLGALLGLPASSSAPVEAAPEPPLPPFTLAGTLSPTYAAVLDDEGHMRTLAVGERLGESEVVSVERAAVTLRHRGRLVRAEVTHPLARPSPGPGQGASPVPLSRTSIARALEQLPLLVTQVQLVPVFSSGPGSVDHGSGGFRIQRLEPGSILASAGLKVGDVLRAVNGLPLSRADTLARLLAEAPTARRVEIDLTRSGQLVHLGVDLAP